MRSAFKMKGIDFGNKKPQAPKRQDHTNVPLSEHEKKKGTMVIGGNLRTEKDDLEMRIGDLNSDIADEGQEGPTKTRAQVMKLEKRLKKVEKLLSTKAPSLKKLG